MYAKCGTLADARRILDEMPERDVVSWTAIIAAYARHGYPDQVLILFYQMQRTGIQPNQYTFATVLPACANLTAIGLGRNIHEQILRTGYQSDVFVGSALLDMYAKCGSIENARYVFDKMTQRDVVSWNAMIAGYAQNGLVDDALALFDQMHQIGIQPDQFTFASVIPACTNLSALEDLHAEVCRNGFQSNIFVANALVDMYAKCGSIENARRLFGKISERSIVSWNCMIAGYVQNGYVDEAMKLFQKMPERDMVSWNAMIAGYAQSGHVEEALQLFQQMPERNVVSWNAMMAAYARHGRAEEALNLFYKMLQRGIQPNQFTFASILPACANLAALEHGKKIHEEIIASEFQSDVFVSA